MAGPAACSDTAVVKVLAGCALSCRIHLPVGVGLVASALVAASWMHVQVPEATHGPLPQFTA